MRENTRTMKGDWGLTFKNIFLPIFCRQCGCPLLTDTGGFFCVTCWSLPERIERPFCNVCGQPQKGRVGFGQVKNFPCAKCSDAPPKALCRTYAAADYDGAIAEAIKLLKFHDRRRIALPLAELMAEFAEREMDCGQYDDLVPVPLHPVRQRARGFNQSFLLAGLVLPMFDGAQLNTSLRRIRPTRTQSMIKDPKERRKNVVGAFAVDTHQDFEDRAVLLIDDVVTTGGTVAECARALGRAGAARVDVLAAAMPIDNPEPHDLSARVRRTRLSLGRFVPH